MKADVTGVRASRRRKDLAPTYEEAWDLKMSRRLGGMDVSCLTAESGNRLNRLDPARASDRLPITNSQSPLPVTVVRSPSLTSVLTSTEVVVRRRRDQAQLSPQASSPSYRNSSTDTVLNRVLTASPFRLKQNRVGSHFSSKLLSSTIPTEPHLLILLFDIKKLRKKPAC